MANCAAHAALAVLFLLPTGLSGQVGDPGPRQVDTRMDAGGLDAFVFDVEVETPVRSRGEAFEGMNGGWGVGISAGAHFESGHNVRLRLATGSWRDTLADDRAESVILSLAATWEARIGSRLVLEVGPAAGYAWLSRAIYRERARGPAVGFMAAATRPIGRRFAIRASARLDWFEFHNTNIIGLPADPDGEALGNRLALALAVRYALR